MKKALMGAALVSGLLLFVSEGHTEKVVGIKKNTYMKTFLEEKELKPLRLVQDTRKKGPDPKDVEYKKHKGLHSGFSVWMGRSDKTVWRLVDIRWVFPSAKQAKAYHLSTLKRNSEGNPHVKKAPKVGSECKVYGGTQQTKMVSMTHYFYIFRVNNVVVKLYAAQGPNILSQKLKLTPEHLSKYAKMIVKRLKSLQ